MKPHLIFDAHLDLAWNAMNFNRDQRLPLEVLRRRELALTEKGRGRNTVCFPEMRRGNVGLCVATLLTKHLPFFTRPPGPDVFERLPAYTSQEQAWAAAQGQLAWYREMEACGEMTPIRDRAQLDAHLRLWLDAAPGSEAKLPIGHILSFENADPIVSMKHLERAWAEGVRAIGPVHYGPGVYGHGTDDEGPLTPRGHELLKEMERLGIILDVTHLCDESFWDAMNRFSGLVWASHSNCRALARWNRQFDDDQIRELIRRGAVLGMSCDAIMLVHGYVIGRSQPADFGLKIDRISDHIDHICQLAGNARHVGIGTDLDGGFGTEQCPTDLDSIADVATLADLLAARGYGQADIDGILWSNFVNLARKALR